MLSIWNIFLLFGLLFTKQQNLNLLKFNAFADKIISNEDLKFVLVRIENIVEQKWQIVTKYARLTLSCNHPRNFIAIASLILERCSGQYSSMKINKGQ